MSPTYAYLADIYGATSNYYANLAGGYGGGYGRGRGGRRGY